MTVSVMAAGEKQHLVFQSLPQDQSEAVISPQSHFTPVLIMNVWKKKRSVLPIIISSQKREGDVLFDEEVHSKQQGNKEKRKNRLVSPSAIL